MSNPVTGQTIGQYRIVDELGAGGMGVVYKAQDTRLGRLVALKMLPQATAGDQETIERFRREARTASSLNHANICTIYNFDEHGGRQFLVMELLDGVPLDGKLAGRPFDLPTILDLGIQVADALDAAHAAGVLHRDIKPANIFVTRRGQIKVLDFGLAKLAQGYSRRDDEDDAHPTAHFTSTAGTTVGTVAYMSPEQARGEELDPRTDLFSFGVVLYEMATGRQSFPGATTAVVFDGILNRDPLPPSKLNAAVPMELDRIISKALEKDRALRYQTAADMRADLQRLRRDSGIRRNAPPAPLQEMSSATVLLPSGSATAAPQPQSGGASAQNTPTPFDAGQGREAGALSEGTQRTRLRPGYLVAAALVALLVVAAAGYYRSTLPRGDDADVALGQESPSQAAPPVPNPGAGLGAPPVAQPTAPSPAPPVAPPEVATSPLPVPAPTTITAAATPAPARVPRVAAAANERLEIARAKIANQLLEPALGDLRQILVDYPGTAAAADASLMSADILEKLGRAEDAMAAHVEFGKRFAADKRAPASKLRLAELTARSRRPDREMAARDTLTEVIANYPRTPQALQALQMKIRIDGERRERELDPALGVEVPVVVPTLRTLIEQFPRSPATMVALNRLTLAYVDLGQFERAAQTLTTLGTNFPNNPHDAWFRLGELYERRLKDPVRARRAFAKVPKQSRRYQDAQRKLSRSPG